MAILGRGKKVERGEGKGVVPYSFLLICLTSLLTLSAGLASVARAQAPSDGIIYSQKSVMRIPFEVDATERRLREVQLYVSEDRGLTWQKASSAAPDQRFFNFRAERDGLHWFTVRTVDMAGGIRPPTLEGVRPGLSVYVDTHPPVIVLRARPAREGMATVEWDIREDNLDLSSFSLEYRLPGNVEWIPLSAQAAVAGQHTWSPGTNGVFDVRLRVRDLARNEGDAKITLAPNGQEVRGANSPPDQELQGSSPQSLPGTRWVNSKKISLKYEVKEEGPSGISVVELWATRDGREWAKFNEDPSHQSPYVFDVSEEGVYGFTLVVRSGVGLSVRPPRPGERPQVWIEVDLTKPIVHWVNADVGRGADTGNLTITWKATDKNLAREPITISYAKDAAGLWTPIASNIENSGRFVWRMPTANIPYKFYVKVEAADKAHNVGSAETPKAVIVDLHEPKGLILEVEPATGGK
jgi:hypothetical protein